VQALGNDFLDSVLEHSDPAGGQPTVDDLALTSVVWGVGANDYPGDHKVAEVQRKGLRELGQMGHHGHALFVVEVHLRWKAD
jgi:hypothetical protein